MQEDKKFTILANNELLFRLKWRLFFKKSNKKQSAQTYDIRVRGP